MADESAGWSWPYCWAPGLLPVHEAQHLELGAHGSARWERTQGSSITAFPPRFVSRAQSVTSSSRLPHGAHVHERDALGVQLAR